jgi:hypothetical protein
MDGIVGFDEDVLGNIGGIVRVVDDVVNDGKNTPLVGVDELC